MLDFHRQIKRRYGELLALGGIVLAMMGIELLISFLFATFEDGNNTLVFSGVIVIAFTFFSESMPDNSIIIGIIFFGKRSLRLF